MDEVRIMEGRKVVVLGAAGFIGRACVRALADAGAHVIGIGSGKDAVPGAHRWLSLDLFQQGLPDEVLSGLDVLLHMAWRNIPGRGNSDMKGDVLTNVASAVGIFEQAARAGARRIVYASSGGTIYGRAEVPTPEDALMAPIGGYGAGKAAAEMFLHAIHHVHGIQTCAMRIANPYGPGQYPDRGQGFIATAIAHTLRRQPIEIFGSIEMSRDYFYVDDVARGIVMACADERPQVTWNIGSGRDLTMQQVLDLVFQAVGHDTEIRHGQSRPMDIARMALDISRIEAELGWRPTTGMEAGLARTVEWVRSVIAA
jgi:UDP-glucose 4-epimerase